MSYSYHFRSSTVPPPPPPPPAPASRRGSVHNNPFRMSPKPLAPNVSLSSNNPFRMSPKQAPTPGERSTTASSYDNDFDGFVPDNRYHVYPNSLTVLQGVPECDVGSVRGSRSCYECPPPSPMSPSSPMFTNPKTPHGRDADVNMNYVNEMLFDEQEFYIAQGRWPEGFEFDPPEPEKTLDELAAEEGVPKKTLKNRARRKRQHARRVAMKAELKERERIEQEERQRALAFDRYGPPPGFEYLREVVGPRAPYGHATSLFSTNSPDLLRLHTAPSSPMHSHMAPPQPTLQRFRSAPSSPTGYGAIEQQRYSYDSSDHQEGGRYSLF